MSAIGRNVRSAALALWGEIPIGVRGEVLSNGIQVLLPTLSVVWGSYKQLEVWEQVVSLAAMIIIARALVLSAGHIRRVARLERIKNRDALIVALSDHEDAMADFFRDVSWCITVPSIHFSRAESRLLALEEAEKNMRISRDSVVRASAELRKQRRIAASPESPLGRQLRMLEMSLNLYSAYLDEASTPLDSQRQNYNEAIDKALHFVGVR